jgi:hypothetical protein
MSLFIVRHVHPADRCPAKDEQAAAMLLKHLSPGTARTFGLTIRGEAVVNNAHTLYLIVDGPDRDSVQRFMEPFGQAGSVEILPASTCEDVAARGGCDAAG